MVALEAGARLAFLAREERCRDASMPSFADACTYAKGFREPLRLRSWQAENRRLDRHARQQTDPLEGSPIHDSTQPDRDL